MAEPWHMELSVDLFPPTVVIQATQLLAERLRIHTVSSDHRTQTLHVFSRNKCSPQSGEELFLEELTRQAVAFWSAEQALETDCQCRSCQTQVDCTLRVVDDPQRTLVVLAANLAVHSHASVLAALRPLLGRAQVLLESTNPIDRLVVRIRPCTEEPMVQLIADLLTAIKCPGSKTSAK